MNTVFTSLLAMLLLALPLQAQKPSVFFDYGKGHFNENQPMPAETYFMLTSSISQQVQGVSFKIYRDKPGGAPLYEAFWKRPAGDATQTLSLPVNYMLRGGNEYDFEISYYRAVAPAELQALRESLSAAIGQYLQNALGPKSRQDRLAQSAQQAYDDLNDLLRRSLQQYRSYSAAELPEYSDLVKHHLRLLYKMDFKKDIREQEMAERIAQTTAMLMGEAGYYLASGLMIMADRQQIDNYPTQKVMNIMTLQVGYGATHFDGSIEDLDYGTGLQLGLVLPLGRQAFASPFWSRSSIVAGFYTSDFVQQGERISGPIFGRPLYAGLGYRLFRFVRLNAGTTLLENPAIPGLSERKVYMRPYIGISADIKLWFDLAK